MRSQILACIGILIIYMYGCKNDQRIKFENYADKFELNTTNKYSYQLERAVLYANAVLEDSFRYRLIPTWQTSILSPHFSFYKTAPVSRRSFTLKDMNDSIQECSFKNYLPVPVYLIDDDKLGNSENIFVPDNSNCILVNSRFIDTLWKDFGISELEPDRRHSITLALILLHELGHLKNGDAGSYIAPQSISANDSISYFSLSRNKEYLADMFAINELDKARNKNDTASFNEKILSISSNNLVGEFYRALSYGRSEFEIHRDVLGFFNGKNTFLNFKTNNYTHPNLYLRFMLMNYALSKDQEILRILTRKQN